MWEVSEAFARAWGEGWLHTRSDGRERRPRLPERGWLRPRPGETPVSGGESAARSLGVNLGWRGFRTGHCETIMLPRSHSALAMVVCKDLGTACRELLPACVCNPPTACVRALVLLCCRTCGDRDRQCATNQGTKPLRPTGRQHVSIHRARENLCPILPSLIPILPSVIPILPSVIPSTGPLSPHTLLCGAPPPLPHPKALLPRPGPAPTMSFDTPGALSVPDASESVSLFISLTCITIMSTLFGRKTAGTNFATINYARALVIGLNLLSLLFSFSAALLVQTNDFNPVSCEISLYFCIFLYASSKVVIYLFLIERVHIVTAIGVSRWNSPSFKFNMVLILPYAGMIILAILYRVVDMSDDGICKIGLRNESALPLIGYDFLLSSWLTFLFLRSLISSTSVLQGPTKSKLREVARRTLLGSTVALLLSTANISTFVYFRGHERGLICLSLCTLDVTLNAITIHWVTSRANSNSNRAGSGRASTGAAVQPFPLHPIDKQVSPLESHISVSIESYVEEYHQMHIANRIQ